MSPEVGGSSGVPGPRWRAIIALGLTGLLLGFIWGVADVPRYSASASVVVNARGGADAADPAQLERFAQRGAGAEVALEAAGLLGGDVAGADLLSDVTLTPDPAGVLLVEASADTPDFAAAAADGFARALVNVEGKPLELGAAATLPGSPSENRSAVLSSAIGLALGLLFGALLLGISARGLAKRRVRKPARELQPEHPPALEPVPAPAPAEDAFGVSVLARFGDPGDLIARVGAQLEVDPSVAGALADLAEDLGLEHEGGPRTFAVLEASAGDGAEAVTLALATAAAEIGLRAIVVEAKLRHPTLAERIGVAASPGLRDYLRGQAGPRDVLRIVPAVSGEGRSVQLVCVPAGERRADLAEGIAGARFDALLERLPRVYDLVLFVAPAVLDDDDAAVLAGAVDDVVLVSADDEGAGSRITRGVELLEPARLTAGVLTGVQAAQAVPQSGP